MTMLSMIQQVCAEIGLPQPNAVATSTDSQLLQMMALLNREGKELAKRIAWQALRKETSFTTVATESQGSINTIAPGLNYIVNNTIWNRDLKRPVFGPLDPQRWQQLEALTLRGPWNEFIIRENTLRFIPAPAAGQPCYFEYITKNWCTDSTGATGKTAFTADDDVPLLDDDIMTMGLIWRWKQAKGFAYAEEFSTYERLVANAAGRDGSKQTLNMADTRYDMFPGIVVPSGNWSV